MTYINDGRRKGYIRKGDLETLLDGGQDFLVLVGSDERDSKTLGAETASTTNAMEVGISIPRQIVVDCQVDTLDVNATTENVSGNADALVELLELLVSANAT